MTLTGEQTVSDQRGLGLGRLPITPRDAYCGHVERPRTSWDGGLI